MPSSTDCGGLDEIPRNARDRRTTRYDYIIVGSGAGGAPLAARLAQAGKRVLVLEAGHDPGAPPADPDEDAAAAEDRRHAENEHAIFHCPGYHGAASEPELYKSTPPEGHTSWHFNARHFEDDETQRKDEKIRPKDKDDPSIFYPRNSSIGGCTAHNSMVTVYGTNYDWEQIQKLTGDPSWSPTSMRYYFKRLERARYSATRFTKLLAVLNRIKNWINPGHDAGAGHGMAGWLDITNSDPKNAGKAMLKTITSAVEVSELGGLRKALRALKRVRDGHLFHDLDPNDERTMRNSPEGAALVPISSGRGMRSGPRDFLLETRRKFGPVQLTIVTNAFVRRVIFEAGDDGDPPVAVGVEVQIGSDLYEASVSPDGAGGGTKETELVQCFTRGEVILAGGAFNTPQLLMLSGVGEKKHLQEFRVPGPRNAKGETVSPIVELEGVGANLRDRYEVSVITEMKDDFDNLTDVNFDPDRGHEDSARRKWEEVEKRIDPLDGKARDFREGLYSTSGASIAVLKKSHPDLERPDLFLFGFPAAFRGYYPGWSRDTLSRKKGDEGEPACRNLWSWAILKAYSSNRGWVRLKSNDPLEAPAINFNYFAEKPGAKDLDDDERTRELKDADQDMAALVEGVSYARRLIKRMKKLERRNYDDHDELQPGRNLRSDMEDTSRLEEWIKTQSWGHHACGTCRIGKDPWQASPGKLEDRGAVLDSKFRVHGVRGLRVVDASVFPEIPGYFIAAPTYMIAEKAADTLLASEQTYPPQLRRSEAAAVHARRRKAHPATGNKEEEAEPGCDALPEDAVGVAFSGGGIRSATFCLGVLQGLARKNRLRDIDFLSTISGGGYTGSFLGALFQRDAKDNPDPVAKVQETLTDPASPPIRWLRSTANYLMGAGGVDARQLYGILLRNLLTIHLIYFLIGLAAFGASRWLANHLPAFLQTTPLAGSGNILLASLSPWWWVPALILAFWTIPAGLAYWLAPKAGTNGSVTFFPVSGLLAALCGLIVLASLPGGALPTLAIGAILIAAVIWMELARPRDEAPVDPGNAMRNRLSIIGTNGLFTFLAATGFVLLDSIGRGVASGQALLYLAALWALVMPVLPFARSILDRLKKSRNLVTGLAAFTLAAVLLILVCATAHLLYEVSGAWGLGATVITILCSWIFGANIPFANSSSLLTSYSARLARTFLGASNPERTQAGADARTTDVRLVNPGDDIPFHEYHPEQCGGPLHLLGVCVNETVDFRSQRDIADYKGMLMTVGPCGLSVGRYHGLWTEAEGTLPLKIRLTNALDGVIHDPEAATAIDGIRVPNREFHPLRRKNDAPVLTEPLSLRSWMGISAAAFTTGLGRQTSLATSLLLGLTNIRLGYWWDTRLEAGDRPGRIGKSLRQRLAWLPLRLARMQMLLFAELRARFAGPSERFWYLSDGGHIDVSGIFELIRRRLPLIVAVDAGTSGLDNVADIVFQVRRDFGAEIEFLEPSAESKSDDWDRFEEHDEVPAQVKEWFAAKPFGSVEKVRERNGPRAALARITYHTGPPATSWLVVLKPSLTGSEPIDIAMYGEHNPDFPAQSTLDQFFDSAQWESYRKLGELTADEVLQKK